MYFLNIHFIHIFGSEDIFISRTHFSGNYFRDKPSVRTWKRDRKIRKKRRVIQSSKFLSLLVI